MRREKIVAPRISKRSYPSDDSVDASYNPPKRAMYRGQKRPLSSDEANYPEEKKFKVWEQRGEKRERSLQDVGFPEEGVKRTRNAELDDLIEMRANMLTNNGN